MLQESYRADPQRLLPRTLEDRLVGLLARGTGVGLCMVGAAGWLSLLSWSVVDPSLTHATGGTTSNLLGPIGAVLSDLLLQTLGFAAVFVMLAPMCWGLELARIERIARPRLRLVLFSIAVLALAAGCSALPTAKSWPLHHGLGGIIGDVLFGATSGMLSSLGPVGPQAVTGLVSFAGGLTALSCSLGLGVSDLVNALRAPEAGWGRGREWSSRLPARLRRDWRRREPSLDAPSRVDDGFRHMPPAAIDHSVGLGQASWTATAAPSVRRGPGQVEFEAEHEPMPLDAHEREPDFDSLTEDASRAIAERFAPVSGARASRPAEFHDGGLLGALSPHRPSPAYRAPGLNMLKRAVGGKSALEVNQAVLRGNARRLEDVLADFGVKGEVKNIRPGPVVTLFELEPARGTKSSRVIGLADDIARSMSTTAVRAAVIPGRNALGFELPNARRETVYLRELLEAEPFRGAEANLPLALGKSIGGEPVIADLARMPHLLVAGTTGSGKSVGINAMVLSLLYRLSPEECRLLLIDPKMLELSVYNGIPHLLTPVVTDPQRAIAALNWAVREMEERYKRMAQLGVRNIDMFNTRVRNARQRGESLARTVQTGFDAATGEPRYEREQLALAPMPYIVVVVDEFADLMIVAGKEIEAAVQRLAQMARAAGIHLIMATQRPSVDIITGTIKANFPTRISFKVTSKVDSRTILNEQGAEQLLGSGDMLFSVGSGQVQRVHGPFVGDDEVENIVQFLRRNGEPRYVDGITDEPAILREDGYQSERSQEELYDKALAIVLRDRKASTSYLQRRLSIGYNRAADLIERMERDGIIGPPNATGRRAVLVATGAAVDAA